MKIRTSSADSGVLLIQVEGEVDAHTARELDRTLRDLLAQGHVRLVLDVAQMGFISSAGLRAIVFAQREADQRGGRVRLCGPSTQLRHILETACLDEYLQLSDTLDEALKDW